MRVNGCLIGPPRRDCKTAPVEQHRDRVQIAGVRLESHAVGFKRDGAAASKWIEDAWKLIVAMLQHFRLRLCIYLRRLVELLPHHLPQDIKKPLTLGV